MHSFLKKSSLAITLLFGASVFVFSHPSSADAQIPFPIPLPGIVADSDICDILAAINFLDPRPDPVYPWYDDHICGFQDKVFGSPDDELYGERYTYAQVGWIINAFVLHSPAGFAFREGFIGNLINILVQNDPGQNHLAEFGLPGAVMGGISYLLDHPIASGIESTRQTLAKFNFVQPVHAQGYGYGALSGIRWLWTASRNLSYLLIVIILIVSGFAVLFRLKINPQTVVTLQLLIPRLVIALIGITFSYAIAGFVIDLIYVCITVIITGLSLGSGFDFTPITPLLTGGFTNFSNTYTIILVILSLYNLITFNFGVSIGFLIIFFITLFLLIKVLWLLLKSYVTLIALVIVGPWLIMLGVLPNNPGFGGWFRSLVANASVFVVVPLMFLFNLILWILASGGGWFDSLIATIAGFLPASPGAALTQLLGIPAGTLPDLPLLSGQSSSLIFMLIGYVILAMIPKTAELIRDVLKIPPFKYGSAIGEAITQPYGIYQGYVANQQAKAKATGNPDTFMAQGAWYEVDKRIKAARTGRTSDSTGSMGG